MHCSETTDLVKLSSHHSVQELFLHAPGTECLGSLISTREQAQEVMATATFNRTVEHLLFVIGIDLVLREDERGPGGTWVGGIATRDERS